jgi:hypothetical protein
VSKPLTTEDLAALLESEAFAAAVRKVIEKNPHMIRTAYQVASAIPVPPPPPPAPPAEPIRSVADLPAEIRRSPGIITAWHLAR